MSTQQLHISSKAVNNMKELSITPSNVIAEDEVVTSPMAISYEIQLEHCDSEHPLWARSSTPMGQGYEAGDAWVGTKTYGIGQVRVCLYTAKSICTLEFNAARFVSDEPLYLLPPQLVKPLAERLIWHLHDAVWPAFMRVSDDGEITLDPDWDKQVKFRRLDIARNLHIPNAGPVKSALEAIECRHSRRKSLEMSRNGGWTLYSRTSKSGLDKIYDKTAEARAKDPDVSITVMPDDMFRFETQIQGERRKVCGLTTLDRLTDQRAWDALSHRWEQTRWGGPISDGLGLAEALSGQTPDMALRLLGYLASEAHGGLLSLDKRKCQDLAIRCRGLGLIPGVPLEQLGRASRHIDLLVGGLVDDSGSSLPVPASDAGNPHPGSEE